MICGVPQGSILNPLIKRESITFSFLTPKGREPFKRVLVTNHVT